jgi:hypothetical protein
MKITMKNFKADMTPAGGYTAHGFEFPAGAYTVAIELIGENLLQHGKSAAIKTLNLKEEIAALNAKGIVHAIRTQSDMEEASGAYKDIDMVMAQQSDLVEIKTRLLPIAVIKG